MKYKYSLDSNNRLIINSARMKKGIVVNGRFNIDKNNKLIYLLNEPNPWKKQYSLPNKINFAGNWRLSPNYDLAFNLIETEGQYKGDTLTLKGEIISADRDLLVFEIKSLDKQGQSHIQLLKLNGLWQANEFNQIIFRVKKKTLPDILTLEGIWQVNKNQQITYTYEKTDLKTKNKYSHTLLFIGFWQINSINRLTYILIRSSQSRFDFRAQIETPNLYPKAGRIKYRLGLGIKEVRVSFDKLIYLYGAWKFSRKAGLNFQMDYGQGKIQSIEFGANIYLSKKEEVVFSLTNKRNEPLGIYITFTHRFLKKSSAEAFLRLKRFQRETGIEAGARIPF